LMENGKASPRAFGYMATLIVTSWIVLTMAINKTLTDVIFAAYGAMWVAPIVASMFSPAPAAQEAGTVISSVVKTTEIVPAAAPKVDEYS
jgi:hypothetical protein